MLATATNEKLLASIQKKTATVGIVGLGYVGLPLVNAFVHSGFRTMGFDVDASKVEKLRAGQSYIKHLPGEWIRACVDNEQFIPTADMSRLGEADTLLICVPTPLSDSRDPDLSYVESTTRFIAKTLRRGQIVILESTTYPGTTRDVVLPILQESNLEAGKDFFLAYSPEREDPGNPNFSATTIPKVVGGIDADSLKIAQELYSRAVVKTVPVSNCEIAEACKILENTYRSVNIAMVNELKVLFTRLDVDIWEVIDAAKTKPFGFQAFYPGPGLGGHCIPIDPFYLSWLARKHELSTRFIELAGEINASMPKHVINRVAEALNARAKPIRGSKIAVLGVAYKKDVDDPRESPSFKLIELLAEGGALLTYNDPHIASLPAMRSFDVPALDSQALTAEYVSAQDCILIATDHSAYDYTSIVQHAQLVVDTRNATKNVTQGRDKIVKA
ncbi:MAG: nucleotide sugar dehydrogenase [Pirellulaceae bacterium]|nr:nucleotide sugar dehydrogenase [Pirellulaceae bacterium]